MSLTPAKRNRRSLGAASFLFLLCATCLPGAPSSGADICAVPSFGTPRLTGVKSYGPTVMGDFNGDGRIDTVTIDRSGDVPSVSVLMGVGDGTFALAAEWVADYSLFSMAVGDFNGDGRPDLLTGYDRPGTPLAILFGDGTGRFPTKREIALDDDPPLTASFLAVEDFDGDGNDDVAVLDGSLRSVAMLLGDGAGGFGRGKFYKCGFENGNITGSNFLVVADLNRDGKPDLVAGTASGLASLLGDGAGGFAAPVAIRADLYVLSAVAADFNGDGNPDLAVAGFNDIPPMGVSVLLGKGDGGFDAAKKYDAKGGASSVISADFNSDGHLDLAVSTTGIRIFQGDGAGGFKATYNYYVDGGWFMSAAELNGDGKPDLIFTTGPYLNHATGLNSCGTGTATPALQFESLPTQLSEFEPTSYTIEPYSTFTIRVVRSGSLEGEVSVDYATSNGTADASDYVPLSGTLRFADGEVAKSLTLTIINDNVYEGDENFTLTLSNPVGATLAGQSTAVFVIPANDGPPHLWTGSYMSVAEGNSGTTDVVFNISLANPSVFTTTVDYVTESYSALADEDFISVSGTLTFRPGETTKPVTVRVNGDTLDETTELFFLTIRNPTNAVLWEPYRYVPYLRTVGTIRDDDASCPIPNFAPPVHFGVGAAPRAVVSADFNRDGKPDLAVGNFGSSTVSVLRGDGAGGFAAAANFTAGVAPKSLAVGDFNRDGKPDLAATGTESGTQVAVLLGDGAGGFGAPSAYTVGTKPGVVAADDLNGDGKTDLAVLNSGSSDVSVLPGDGAGGFAAPTNYAVGSGSVDLTTGDLNGDGRPDLVVAALRERKAISILINKGGGDFAPAVGLEARWVKAITVADLDGDKSPDIAAVVDLDSIDVLLGDGAGGFTSAGRFPGGNAVNLPDSIAAADFNGDTRTDIVVGNIVPGGVRGHVPGLVAVFFGNGQGGLSPALPFAPERLRGSAARGMAAGDFNGDGRLDLAFSNSQEGDVTLLLNACSAVKGPPRVQFGSPAYNVSEKAGEVVISVVRSGDFSAQAAVEYVTTGGTASGRGDYAPALGRLHFAAGEVSKTFSVFVTDDALVEGPETVTLTLRDAEGATVGVPGASTITISSDDVTGPSANPIDDDAFFVRQHYRDFLNRDPDPPGLRFWTGEIGGCGADARCREVRRINVSAAFFLSIEFQQTGFLVHQMQAASYGTLPRHLAFLRDTQAVGHGIVVNQGDWQAQLEYNKRAFADAWVARPEFRALYDGKTDAQYVDALIANTGVAFTPSARDALVAGLGGETETRATVLRKVAEDQAFARKEFGRAFVLMQYFGYLRRDPDDAPDSGLSGYNFWLSKLDRFHGDYIAAEMVKGFLNSIEYKQRFGQP